MMKYCGSCGNFVEDNALFCPICGGEVKGADPQPQNPAVNQPPVYDQTPPMVPADPMEGLNNGNVALGALGALLFSVGGGVLYFVLYQMGFLAGISGFVMFWLGCVGYRLFAKTKNKNSIPAMVCAIVAMVIMILLAEYTCLSYEVYQVFSEEGFALTFGEAFEGAIELLEEPEVRDMVIEDLVYSYLFGFLAVISDVVRMVKARKNDQTA